MIDHIQDKGRVGVTLDTCHLYAAGFDIKSAQGWQEVLQRFTDIVGWEYLSAMHVNDSKQGLGSKRSAATLVLSHSAHAQVCMWVAALCMQCAVVHVLHMAQVRQVWRRLGVVPWEPSIDGSVLRSEAYHGQYLRGRHVKDPGMGKVLRHHVWRYFSDLLHHLHELVCLCPGSWVMT